MVSNIVVFFTAWWPAVLVSAFILFAVGVESLLLAAIVATVFASFVVWFLNKAPDLLTGSVVAIFGNEPARNAVVAQYQGTRDPAEVIVEDEVAPSDGLEERMRRLAGLRDQGLITADACETQKRRLLDEAYRLLTFILSSARSPKDACRDGGYPPGRPAGSSASIPSSFPWETSPAKAEQGVALAGSHPNAYGG